MRVSGAGIAGAAIKLDRRRKNSENECVPEQEEWVKLPDWSLDNDTHPGKDEGKCGKRPHSFPEPAFHVF